MNMALVFVVSLSSQCRTSVNREDRDDNGKHGSPSELKLLLIEETRKECVPLATTVWNGAEDRGLRWADLS